MSTELQDRLALAHRLADLAGTVLRQYFRQPYLPAETKGEEVSAIVTLADQEAEDAMVAAIREQFPLDGIIREEGADYPSQSGYAWVLDPIDGTSAFVRGLPTFGILIGLVDSLGTPLLGIADQPILGERWQGLWGETSFYQGQPIQNPYGHSSPLALDQTCLASTTPLMFTTPRQRAIAAHLQNTCRRTAFGGDCYNYLCLAAGKTAMPLLILEADMKYYDFCALIPILQGAGASITDWAGRPLTPYSTEILAASNPSLHQLALQAIARCPASQGPDDD
ncbi:inositol monophosphatase family protein [Synechocystis sp. LKSZ1]|uniref:inositol monophosphatase family protein n=1 Tax=Synechocystis sp. LKSZ1 TaxID=3144951 RepID=UPI00336BC2A4